MSRDQRVFDLLTRDLLYGPREGFEPREWQIECAADYMASVGDWLDAPEEWASHQPDIDIEATIAVNPRRHDFTVYAGPGSGKTKAVAMMAADMLNRRLVEQVVFICPNRSIKRKTAREFFKYFGIDLEPFNADRHRRGIGRLKQGYILTYGHMARDPAIHREICSVPTLVIFDEVHHLGDKGGSWGEKAIEAFACVPFTISLTGTPYRHDNRRIPFVSYRKHPGGELLEFAAEGTRGYSYTLGRAVADGVCRDPIFDFFDSVIKITPTPTAAEIHAGFYKDINEQLSSIRLRGAVSYASDSRKELLRTALERCRAENRKVIIFLGGDTQGETVPTEDATVLLPSQLREFGISPDEYEVVVGDDKESQDKIERFGSSGKWILISVQMVSEGTDIPEISAAIFLTTITSKQTTIQRIGRVLRMMQPDDPYKTALIFMFADPALREIAKEIKDQIKSEVQLKRGRELEVGETPKDVDPDRPARAEAISVGPLREVMISFNGKQWPAERFNEATQWLREKGLPGTMLETALYLMNLEDTNGNGDAA